MQLPPLTKVQRGGGYTKRYGFASHKNRKIIRYNLKCSSFYLLMYHYFSTILHHINFLIPPKHELKNSVAVRIRDRPFVQPFTNNHCHFLITWNRTPPNSCFSRPNKSVLNLHSWVVIMMSDWLFSNSLHYFLTRCPLITPSSSTGDEKSIGRNMAAH